MKEFIKGGFIMIGIIVIGILLLSPIFIFCHYVTNKDYELIFMLFYIGFILGGFISIGD